MKDHFPQEKTFGQKRKGVAEKTVVSGHECDSGSRDMELSKAAGALYKDAAANRGGGPVIRAIQER